MLTTLVHNYHKITGLHFTKEAFTIEMAEPEKNEA
jgi:hypothetical protein